MLSRWRLALGSVVAAMALGACTAFGAAQEDAPVPEAGAPDGTTADDASAPGDAPLPAPLPEIVQAGLSNPRGIVATPKWVYWTDTETGILWRVSTGSDRTVYEFKNTGAAPSAITAHGETVHWSEYGQRFIKSAFEDGGATVPNIGMSYGARAMATNSTRLVYVDDIGVRSTLFDNTGFAAAGTALKEPAELDTDDATTWWTESGDGRVWQSSPDTTNAVAIPGQNDARAILATSTGAIWTRRDGSVIEKTATGLVTRATGFDDPRAIQRDARGLYVLTGKGFFRVPTSGPPAEPLGPSTYRVDLVLAMKGIALTPQHVYWIDNGGGTIYRLPR